MTWFIPLKGPEHELRQLLKYWDRCEERHGVTGLVYNAQGESTTYKQVREVAGEQLVAFKGCLYTSGNHKLTETRLSDRVIGLNSGGNEVRHAVQIGGVIECAILGDISFARIADADGNEVEDPFRAWTSSVMHLRVEEPGVRDVLKLFGQNETPTWGELYYIFETVEACCGADMFKKGWITRARKKKFCRTANSRAALNIESRHASTTSQEVRKPMSYEEALETIRTLAMCWLRFLAEASPKT